MTRSPRAVGDAGFTLIEMLAALALAGLVFSALAKITSQWLPSWNRSFTRIQGSESVSIALERMSSDIGASEMIRPDRNANYVLFEGTELSLTLVRRSLGPNTRPGLDVVRIAETTDKQGFVLTRSSARFTPGSTTRQLVFGNPVVLLRAPYRVSFSYSGQDTAGERAGSWKSTWREVNALPDAVLMTVRDAATERALGISRIAVVHINASAESTCGDLCNQPTGSQSPSAQNAPAARTGDAR
jgi:general secretion pathway protein J